MLLDIFLTLFARAFKALANIFVIGFVARLLGKSELGGYFLSFGLSNPLSFLIPFGVGAAVIRFAVADGQAEVGEQARRVLCTANLAVMLFSIVVCAATYLALSAFEVVNLSRLEILLTLVIAGLMGVLNLQGDSFRALGNYKESSLYSGTLPSAVVLVLFAAAWVSNVSLGLPEVLIVSLVGYLVAVLCSTYVLVRRLKLNVFSAFSYFESKAVIKYFKAGAGSLAGASVGVFLPSLALLVCGALYSSSDVAEFGLAQRVLFFVTLPLWIASTVLPARASKFLQIGDLVSLQSLSGVFSAGIGIVSILVAVAVTFLGGKLLTLIGGAEYPLAAEMFNILAWSSAVYSVFGVAISIVMVSPYSSELFKSLGLALASFVLSVFVLGLYFGAIAVAIAQAVAMLVNAFYAWYVLKVRLNLLVRPDPIALGKWALRRR